MAITKLDVAVFASSSVPAGGTKTALPVGGTGPSINCSTYGRSGLLYRIKNGAIAPGAPGVMVIQISPDGIAWFDYQTVVGTIAADDDISQIVVIDAFVQNLRVLCYGHTTNPVTFEATLQAVAS